MKPTLRNALEYVFTIFVGACAGSGVGIVVVILLHTWWGMEISVWTGYLVGAVMGALLAAFFPKAVRDFLHWLMPLW